MEENFPVTIAERFWAKVDRSSECWLWTGHKDPKGYGRFARHRRPALAHRVSWELTNGPIPNGLLCCHHCDNPPCVRPDHLFIGTHADNSRDMTEKGRHGAFVPTPPRGADWRLAHPDIARGERITGAKLTDALVLAVRDMRASGMTLQAIADQLRVSLTTIHRVTSGRGWRHVP